MDTRKPLEYYLSLRYPFDVTVDPNSGYVAVFPDLPGCMTQGETLEELVGMAKEARNLWIETEYDRGNEIPLPSYPEEYSGKFNLRLPRSLHRALAEAAKREDVSLNQYVLTILARGDAQSRVERRILELEAKLDMMADQISSNFEGQPRHELRRITSQGTRQS